MADNRRKLVAGLAALVAFSLFVCLATGAPAQSAADGRQQVSFVPHFTELAMTRTAEALVLGTPAAQPSAPPSAMSAVSTPPAMVPMDTEYYALCGTLLVEGQSYPIGDRFADASEIPIGTAINGDVWGRNGYAVITDHPDYRLLWVTTDGSRQYVIVHVNDPLLTDETTGFAHITQVVSDGYQALFTVGASALTAAGTLIAVGFTVCAPTVGVGCGLAVGGAIAAGVVSSAGEWWIRATIINPGLSNLELQLQTIDINRGSPHPCDTP